MTGFLVTVASREDSSSELDASIGASGPHDFAVHLSAVRQKRLGVHRIPPHVRDDRETPLVWDGMATNKPVIWVERKQEYFSRDDWTGQITLIRFNKFPCGRTGRHPREGLNICLCASTVKTELLSTR